MKKCLGLAFLAILLSSCGGPSEPVSSTRRPIPPVRVPAASLAELRLQALAATPPAESGPFRQGILIDLAELDPGFQFDIRYATERNFLGTPVYESPQAFLQQEAAWALMRVQQSLAGDGLGLLIYDAYRPWYVTRIFWDATPLELRQFVADPAAGSRHNRGCAVDVSLYDLKTGIPLLMPTEYDDFSPAAHIEYTGGDEAARENRDRLRRAMEQFGFEPFAPEWWHFDYRDWQEYPILNLPFDQIE